MTTLTNENYFSPEMQMEYMGVSQYKDFLDCPARALATIKGEYVPEMTIPMLVGSYVDAYFEGTLDKFTAEHPEIFTTVLAENETTRENIEKVQSGFLTKTGNWKPGALTKARELHPEFFTLKRTLKADYRQAETIIEVLEADELFMAFMAGAKQVIMTAELFGTKWKIKIDSFLSPENVKAIIEKFPEYSKFFVDGYGAIDDLKIMRSMDRIMGVSFVEHWGYDIQMAVYSEVEYLDSKREDGTRLPTFLSVGTKEEVTDKDIVSIPSWRRKQCLADVEKNMPRVLAYKRGDLKAPGCGVCPYCRSKKKASVIDFEMVGFSNKDLAAMEGKAF